jgi:hypothetical protein
MKKTFKEFLDKDPDGGDDGAKKYTIKIIKNPDGSRTATCGAWILMRKFADGKMKEIMSDAPADMMNQAEEMLKNLKEAKEEVEDDGPLEAYGVKGMKSIQWRKTFKNSDELNKWLEKNQAEMQGMRKLEEAKVDTSKGNPYNFGFEHKGNATKAEAAFKKAGLKFDKSTAGGIYYFDFESKKGMDTAVRAARQVIDADKESEWKPLKTKLKESDKGIYCPSCKTKEHPRLTTKGDDPDDKHRRINPYICVKCGQQGGGVDFGLYGDEDDEPVKESKIMKHGKKLSRKNMNMSKLGDVYDKHIPHPKMADKNRSDDKKNITEELAKPEKYGSAYICQMDEKSWRVKKDPKDSFALHHGSFNSKEEAKQFIDSKKSGK